MFFTQCLLDSFRRMDTSASLSQLGMDSLVGVEMRSWWRQAFGFGISVLELLGNVVASPLLRMLTSSLARAMNDLRLSLFEPEVPEVAIPLPSLLLTRTPLHWVYRQQFP
jgi:hypothetical protein